MKKVYLDNAATTQLRPEVISEMVKVLSEEYGNPSSTHSFGRNSKSIVELARKAVARHFNVKAQEIIFTSGATEAINWILRGAVTNLGIERIITSKIEHHAVLYTVEHLQKEFPIDVDYVKVDATGTIDVSHLTELLSTTKRTLVSLMHVNNEVGSVLDIEKVARICKQYDALFMSDTVQSIGKTALDLQLVQADFIVASAHKFHGPKGVGFAYIRKGIALQPLFYGGDQEKGVRSGTESVHNIAGMARALDISFEKLPEEEHYISGLKAYATSQFSQHFPGVKVNGSDLGFYNILNVCLPIEESKASMMLFHLDMKGIAVSRGSACQSGSVKPSHVLAEMLDSVDVRKPSLRISFCHYNTTADVDYLIDALLAL